MFFHKFVDAMMSAVMFSVAFALEFVSGWHDRHLALSTHEMRVYRDKWRSNSGLDKCQRHLYLWRERQINENLIYIEGANVYAVGKNQNETRRFHR